jgi:hypothetical protein
VNQHAADARSTHSPGAERVNGVHPSWEQLRAPLVKLPIEGVQHYDLTPKPHQLTGLTAAQPTPTPTRNAQQAEAFDEDLARAVRRSGYTRRAFYVTVLLIALGGQVTGVVERIHLPLVAAIPAVGALELGGVVVLNDADVRRRLGERALVSRILSAAVAIWAVAFNWLAHANHLAGGFFAAFSALGYAVWLTHTENQRRDRLRAKGKLPPTTPAYELWEHWIKHPLLTSRAKSLAKADFRLGLYESIEAARAAVRAERRNKAIASIMRRRVRVHAPNPEAGELAVNSYEMDQVAAAIVAQANYAALAAVVASDLDPTRLLGEEQLALPSAPAAPPGAPTEALTTGSASAPPAQPTVLHVVPPTRTPTAQSAVPPTRRPTGRKSPRVAGQAHRPVGQPTGLSDVVRERAAQLADEFPDPAAMPGRDKVMAHMTGRGYAGWTTKTTAEKAIAAHKAASEDGATS